MTFDEILILSYTVRVLVDLVFQQRRGQDIAVSTPYIPPAVFPCLNGKGGKVVGILGIGTCKTGYVDLVTTAAAPLITALVIISVIVGAVSSELLSIGVQCITFRQDFK